MTPEPQDVKPPSSEEFDELCVLIELYADQPEDVAKRIIEAGYRRTPSPSTGGASRISREALAKFIGNELNFDAHDLNNDPEQNVCPECLRMADAVLALLKTTPEEQKP